MLFVVLLFFFMFVPDVLFVAVSGVLWSFKKVSNQKPFWRIFRKRNRTSISKKRIA